MIQRETDSRTQGIKNDESLLTHIPKCYHSLLLDTTHVQVCNLRRKDNRSFYSPSQISGLTLKPNKIKSNNQPHMKLRPNLAVS